jgi:hypothetical protein
MQRRQILRCEEVRALVKVGRPGWGDAYMGIHLPNRMARTDEEAK